MFVFVLKCHALHCLILWFIGVSFPRVNYKLKECDCDRKLQEGSSGYKNTLTKVIDNKEGQHTKKSQTNALSMHFQVIVALMNFFLALSDENKQLTAALLLNNERIII